MMEYYLVAILVLVFSLVILVSKNGRIRDKKPQEAIASLKAFISYWQKFKPISHLD